MLNKYLTSLAMAAVLGLFAALLPVHATQDGLSLSYASSLADGEKKKGEKEKKGKKEKDGKSCTKDHPCNDDNQNRKDDGKRKDSDKGKKKNN